MEQSSLRGKDRTIVVGFQTQTCLLSPSLPSTGSHWFHVIYFLFSIPFFIYKAVPLRLQNNAKETRFLWIHIQIYNPAWKRHITSGRDYVALPPAICKRSSPRTEVLSHIHPEGRRPKGCIWINTDVRGVYLTDFMILFMRYRLHKGRLSQGNNWPVVFDICLFFIFWSDRRQWRISL